MLLKSEYTEKCRHWSEHFIYKCINITPSWAVLKPLEESPQYRNERKSAIATHLRSIRVSHSKDLGFMAWPLLKTAYELKLTRFLYPIKLWVKIFLQIMLKGMETEQQNLKLPNSSTPPKLSESGSKCLLSTWFAPKSIVLWRGQLSLELPPPLRFTHSQVGRVLARNPNLQDSKQMSCLLKLPKRNQFFLLLLFSPDNLKEQSRLFCNF